MQELYKKLKKYSLKDAIKIEWEDRQFLALKKLFNSVNNEKYLFLIIANALICYQLSWKWEDYWGEFSEYITPPPRSSGTPLEKGRLVCEKEKILEFFEDFLVNSKNNKRFVSVKLKRIEKLLPFFDKFIWKEEYYYENMTVLRDDLAEIMKQKKDAKTIVFAVKMFSYWARSYFNRLICFPENLTIPIDSRLIKIFEKYKWNYLDINGFYLDLSKKIKIPELHLDAILWNSEDLI